MARGNQKLAPSLGPAGGSDVRDTTARPRHKLPRNSTFLPSWSGSGGLEKQAGEGPTQIGIQVAPSNLPARPTTATLNPSECHPSNPNPSIPSIPSIPLTRLSNCRRRCQSMPSRLPTCSSLPHSSLQGQMQLLDGVCRPPTRSYSSLTWSDPRRRPRQSTGRQGAQSRGTCPRPNHAKTTINARSIEHDIPRSLLPYYP